MGPQKRSFLHSDTKENKHCVEFLKVGKWVSFFGQLITDKKSDVITKEVPIDIRHLSE